MHACQHHCVVLFVDEYVEILAYLDMLELKGNPDSEDSKQTRSMKHPT